MGSISGTDKPQPLIVATIFKNLTKNLSKAKDIGVDFVEIRFDLIKNLTSEKAVKILKDAKSRFGLKIISTLRSTNEGGLFKPDKQLWFEMYKALIEYTDVIDIELRSGILKDIIKFSKKYNKKVIISYHDLNGTPAFGVLKSIYARMKQYNPWAAKIVTRANALSDMAKLIKLLQTYKPKNLAVFCTGNKRKSLLSRYIMPYFGGYLIYGYLGGSAVEGQPHVRHLLRYFKK